MVESVPVKARHRGAGWRSPHWRKAPFVLLRHRSALAAVAAAGALVTLAASSGPLVTTAAASSALKDELVDLTPFGTGLTMTGIGQSSRPAAGMIQAEDARESALSSLGKRLGLEKPVYSVETAVPVTVSTETGDVPLNLLARTGVVDHVHVLAKRSGPGVYISNFTARIAGLKPGGRLKVTYAGPFGTGKAVTMRVKGIYQALDTTSPGPYWVHFTREIFPPGADPPPPIRYVLMERDALYHAVDGLRSHRTVHVPEGVLHLGSGPPLATMAELAVEPNGLTIARAHSLSTRFDRLRHELHGSALGKTLDCIGPRPFVRYGVVSPPRCRVASSISSAVSIADRNVSEISPVVTLLSGAATAIALAFACAAGIFLVRRRAAETALLYARGERASVFGARTALELLLPLATGAAIGFVAALSATGLLAPSGSVDSATVHSTAGRAILAALAALTLGVGAATASFLRQFDTGTRSRPWLRRIPWEIVPLAIAGWLLYDLLSGGGLAGQANGGPGHPTLAVFVFPLLLSAGVAGLVVRAVRPALRPGAGRGASLPAAVFLAVRRLSAAGAVLTALFVVSAVAFGSFFYAEAVASSLGRGVTEKGYIAYGGDAQGLIAGDATLPRSFPYPATRLDYGNQAAVIGNLNGDYADVLAVDGTTLGSVLRWYPDWGPDPRKLLPSLAAHVTRLPILVSDTIPASTRAIWVQSVRVPVQVIGRMHAFPGMTEGVPVVVADRAALFAAARKVGLLDPLSDPPTYVWAKGPPAAVSRALAAPPIEASFVSDVDAFSKQPDVVAATRAFSYMRLIAVASGVLVFFGLILYLQARQRSQAVASSMAARMGLRRATEILSLALELGAIALLAAAVGGVVAVAAAAPVVGHIDPLPSYAPGPTLVIPVAAVLSSALVLLAVAATAGAVTSWASRRTNMAEALRVV
jgi:hypothetical protein